MGEGREDEFAATGIKKDEDDGITNGPEMQQISGPVYGSNSIESEIGSISGLEKDHVKTLVDLFQNKSTVHSKSISDNGAEFTCMRDYFESQGNMFQTSCVWNSSTKRKTCALRFQGHILIKFWGECVLTTLYLTNRLSTLILQGKSPFELLYGTRPDYSHIRVTGCLSYVHTPKGGNKFVNRGRRCMFIGYPLGKKA
ncbi:hypothetical protein V2J09_000936 [Rumex salicifolius]